MLCAVYCAVIAAVSVAVAAAASAAALLLSLMYLHNFKGELQLAAHQASNWQCRYICFEFQDAAQRG